MRARLHVEVYKRTRLFVPRDGRRMVAILAARRAHFSRVTAQVFARAGRVLVDAQQVALAIGPVVHVQVAVRQVYRRDGVLERFGDVVADGLAHHVHLG